MTADEVLWGIGTGVALFAIAYWAGRGVAAVWYWWPERQPRAINYVRCGYPGCTHKIDWRKASRKGWERKPIFRLKSRAEHPEWVYIDVCPEHREEFTP